MDWIECNNQRIVKNVAIDRPMIRSLIDASNNKMESEKILPLTAVTASSKITLAYDALRELLEALSLSKGFKIYNHECYTPFLKEVMNQSLLSDEFDELRKLRNAINYYGKKFSPEDSTLVLNNIKRIIIAVRKLF